MAVVQFKVSVHMTQIIGCTLAKELGQRKMFTVGSIAFVLHSIRYIFMNNGICIRVVYLLYAL